MIILVMKIKIGIIIIKLNYKILYQIKFVIIITFIKHLINKLFLSMILIIIYKII